MLTEAAASDYGPADRYFLLPTEKITEKSRFWFLLENQFWQHTYPMQYFRRGCPSGSNHSAQQTASGQLCLCPFRLEGNLPKAFVDFCLPTSGCLERTVAGQPLGEKFPKAWAVTEGTPTRSTLGAGYSSINSLRVGLPAHKLNSSAPH